MRLQAWEAAAAALLAAALVGCDSGSRNKTTTATAGSTTGSATSATTTGGQPSGASGGASLGGGGTVSLGGPSGGGSGGSGGGIAVGGLPSSGGSGGGTAPVGSTAGGAPASGGAAPGSGTPSSGGGAPAGGGGPLTVTAVPLAKATGRPGQEPVILALRFEAGGAPVVLQGFTIKASGSVNESRDLGAVKVVGDDNADALVDPGEPVLLTQAGGFARNNGDLPLDLSQAVTIAAGQQLQLLVTVEVTATGFNALTLPGKSVVTAVEAATDVRASATASGSFPLSATLLLELNDHLLISEVVRDPWEAEYVEIYNPTAALVDLSNVYLTDYTDDSDAYWKLPTGDDIKPSLFSGDFMARFPQGANIAPGRALVIARDADDFYTHFTLHPDYALAAGSSGNAFQMLTPTSDNPPQWRDRAPSVFSYGLRNSGEAVILFTWDGQSDLVQDLDYVFYGSPSGSGNAKVDKSGQSTDGPDADTSPGTFLSETPTGQQREAATAGGQNKGVQRIEFGELGEVQQGGNGLTGHDETSEPWDTTFTTGQPTPGFP